VSVSIFPSEGTHMVIGGSPSLSFLGFDLTFSNDS
jgi:hypothetical protein